MKTLLRFLVIIIGCSSVSYAFSEQIRNGKWEITSETEMPDMLIHLPAHKETICINNKNQSRPPIATDKSCEFRNYRIIGNDASWEMECRGDLKMTGSGNIKFESDKYKGSAVIKMEMKDSEPIEIDHIYTGKRIGDCK